MIGEIMRTLEILKAAWATDCQIDELNLQTAVSRTPILHSAYLDDLVQYKLRLTKIEHDQFEYKARRSRYYRGEMTKEELLELGWPQWQHRTLKADIEALIYAESDFQKLMARESYIRTSIYFLESVLQEIRARSFHCKNLIEWLKYRAGA